MVDAETGSAADAVIETAGLSKSYPLGGRGVDALCAVNLRIARGEHVAITGPSGSGKSTLLHILGCLDRPTAGSYRLDGREVSDLADDELAQIRNRKIGFVFQTFNLMARLTARANVELPLVYAGMPPGERTERARALLVRVGLAERADHRPSELSGGECQRVAIARAMAADPAMLLADEPTGNLDSKSGEEILHLFETLNRAQNLTLVVITHDPRVAERAGRRVEILDGRIVADVSPTQTPPVRSIL